MKNKLTKSIIYALFCSIILSICFFFIKDFIDIQFGTFNVFLISFCINFLSIFLCIFLHYQYLSINRPKKQKNIEVLQKEEKYRREFFGNVSHELKTPIFNIQGYVETLIDGALYDKNVNKKYLKRTSKSVDRLIYIIKDLESIAQLESEELNLEITTWNLRELVDDIIEQFDLKSQKKKIQLIHDRNSTDLVVSADKGKIGQVLSNLISNSIKYGKRGGRTKISCHQSKLGCVVSIKDNGIGIAEKNIKRLFERFYRVDKSRSREQGGTGLGLAIVKHIIEAHNQNIKVKSTMTKGTEFTFSLNCNNFS